MFKKFFSVVNTFALIAASTIFVSAQVCSNPPITRKDYCNNQFAQIEINDLNSDNLYGWYTATNDNTPSYGTDGDGRKFTSPNIQTAPSIFYYQKEVAMIAGPAAANPSGGVAVPFDGVVPYKMSFANDQDFRLNSVAVIAKLSSTTKTYGFNIRYNDGATNTFGPWLEGKTSDLLDLGSGYYLVEIPLGITITAGTGRSIEFVSDDVATHDPVEAMYWWGPAAYNGGTYADNAIRVTDPDVAVGGTPRAPMIMDWNITLLCARQAVTTQPATVCCTAVNSTFTVTAPKTNPISTDFPMTLTASGGSVNATMFYYWYDANNVLIPGASGQGKNTLPVTAAGQYTVRVVNKAGDEGEFACYGKQSITIGIKSIYAPADFSKCLGEPITLRGEGAEGDYNWKSSDTKADGYIVTHNVQQTDLFVLEPGKYTYTVEGSVKLGNIATDGKFEFFNDANNFNPAQPGRTFETAYGIAQGQTGTYITGPGEYRVDDQIVAYSANSFHCTNPAYWQKTDPVTNDVISRGKIFVADAVNPTGSTAPAYTAAFANANPLWRLSNQPVQPNTEYTFTMDISNWNSGGTPPEIMLLVNGVALGGLIITPAGGSFGTGPDGATYYKYPESEFCMWRTITAKWNSGSNTTATIAVAEVSNILMGHEFAMDDVTFFSGRGIQNDDVVITVTDCNEMQARADGTACIGDPFALSLVKNTGFLLDWKNAAGTVVANTQSANAYPVKNEIYTARVKFPLFNFIKNGSFENSNALDFTSDLIIPPGSSIEQGNYWVGNGNSTLLHSTMKTGQKDHTPGTVAGNMMLMRFKQNQAIISKTIAVKAGEEYGFSAWLKHMHVGGANSRDYPFELLVGGTVVSTFTLTSGQDWTKFTHNWKATANANVTIVLRSPLDHWESGLAIDDITLAQLGREASDDVEVSVSNCFKLVARADVIACAGDEVTLNTITNDGYVTSWEDPAGVVVSTSPTTVVYPTKTGTYLVRAKFPVNNLTINGNFETGAIDFTTDFTKPTGSSTNSGDYIIGKGNEALLHTNSFNLAQKDHTSGTGFMMLARVGNATKSLMTRTIAVTAGQDYAFSAWFKNMHPGLYGGNVANAKDHSIAMYIGGTLAYTYTLGTNPNWNNMLYKWMAATTANTTIELRVTSTNDESALAFDDLKISQLGFEDTDDVLVTVNVCKTLTLSDACINMVRQIYHTTDGVFMGWYNPAGTLISSADTLKLPGITVGQTVTAKIGVPVAAINPNGNMEQGNTVGYNMVGMAQSSTQNQTYPNNEYFYVNNANTITGGEAGFVSLTDADGSGKYLLYHPNSGVDKSLVRTSALSVTAGTAYSLEFSIAYLKNAAYLNAITQLYPVRLFVGGVQVASFTMAKDNTWQKFKYSWIPTTSANNLVVELKVDVFSDYNLTKQLAYGIDALNLKPVTEILKKDITVQPCTPPCVKPNKPSFSTSTPAPVTGKPKTINVCAATGTIATLNGTITTTGTPLTGYNYTIYKSGTTPVYAAGTTVAPKTLTSADNGLWILRAEDGTAGNINCYVEDTVNFIVNAVPAPVITGNATSCEDSVVTFSIQGADPLSGFAWTYTGVSEQSANAEKSQVTVKFLPNTTSAVLSVIETDKNGCSNISPGTKTIAVDQKPPLANAGSNFDVCAAVGTFQLPGNDPALKGVGLWTKETSSTGGTITTNSLYNTAVTGLAGGQKLVATWKIDSQNKYCKSSQASVTVTATTIADPSVNLNPVTTQVCSNTGVILTATPISPGTISNYTFYKASDNSVLQAKSTNPVYTFTGSQSNDVYVVLETNSQCVSAASKNTVQSSNVSVQVDALPTQPNIDNATPTDVCSGGLTLAQLTTITNGNGKWELTTGPGSIDMATGAVTGLVKGQSSKFYYTVESTPNKKCKALRDSVTIKRSGDLSTADAGLDQKVCIGTTVTLNGSSFDAAGNGETVEWLDANDVQIATTQQLSRPGLAAGIHVFKYRIKNPACTGVPEVVNVIVDAKPDVANAGSNDDMCGDQYTLSGNTPAIGKGKWTQDDMSVTFKDNNDTVGNAVALNMPKSKTVTFTWQINNGTCIGTPDTVKITRFGDLNTPNAGTDTTICLGGSVNLVGKSVALATNGESQEWLNPANATLGSNRITAAGPFNTAGSFKYYYKIENTLCGSKLDSVLVNVVSPPLAEITGPITVKAGNPDPNPNTGQKTSPNDEVTLSAIAPLSGYSGIWTEISGEGTIPGSKTNPSAVLKGMVTKDLSTEVSWTVKDDAGVCPAAVAKLIVVRKDLPDVQCPANKVICKSAMTGYELAGNIPVAANLETGLWTSLTSGSAVSATNINKATITQFKIGLNEFEYTITSGALPAPNNVNSCKVTITIDDLTEVPAISTTSGATLVSAKEYKLVECTDKVSDLPGTAPLYSNALWKKDILTGGQGNIANPSLANSEFNNLKTIAQSSVLYWWQKNGVCPADSVKLTVERPDSVTKPVISLIEGGNTTLLGLTAEDICVTSSYTLSAANKKANETYVWSIEKGSSIGLPVDKTTQSQVLTLNSTLTKGDTTIIRLTINPPAGVPCPAAKTDVSLKLHTVPSGYNIAGASPVCEDNTSDFTLQTITSTLPVTTYNWSTGLVADGSTFISQNHTQLKAAFKFEAKNNTTPFTQGSVRASVSNICGKGVEVDKIVVINLRPRNFTVDFGASPVIDICASEAGPVTYNATVNPALPAGNDYNWYWDGQLIAATGSSLDLTGDKYSTKSGVFPLQVKLHNSCGEAVVNDNAWSNPLSVTILKSQLLGVSIKPENPKICEELNELRTFEATPDGITNLLSLNAVYTFTLKDSLGNVLDASVNASNKYTAGGLENGYTISVVLSDPDGCFDSPRTAADVAVIDGYNRPDSLIIPVPLNICDGGTITLEVPESKGNTGYTWYKNDSISVGNKRTLTLTSPGENGTYKVKVDNAICPSSTSFNSTVHIYELPEAHFVTDPLYIEYRDGLEVPIPVVITKPVHDTLIYKMYEQSLYLKDPSSPLTSIVPPKEEKDVDYYLVLQTGKPGVIECTPAIRTLKVIFTLPLKIPDAFTPNGDGLNDFWVIQGINKFPNSKVKIYNRWGTAMFIDNDGFKAGWDGTHNGVPLPTGTYYYIVELLGSKDNSDRTQTGALTIIR